MPGKWAVIGLGVAAALVAMIGLGLSTAGVILLLTRHWLLGVLIAVLGSVMVVGGVVIFIAGSAVAAARRQRLKIDQVENLSD